MGAADWLPALVHQAPSAASRFEHEPGSSALDSDGASRAEEGNEPGENSQKKPDHGRSLHEAVELQVADFAEHSDFDERGNICRSGASGGRVGVLKDWLVRALIGVFRRNATVLTFRDLQTHAQGVSQCDKNTC
jgi:hypothetical protein